MREVNREALLQHMREPSAGSTAPPFVQEAFGEGMASLHAVGNSASILRREQDEEARQQPFCSTIASTSAQLRLFNVVEIARDEGWAAWVR